MRISDWSSDVCSSDLQIVEFQVRTYEMHEFAERGLAASFHYHDQKESKTYKKGKSSTLPSHLQWITKLQEIASRLGSGDEITSDQLNVVLFKDRIFVYSPKGDIFTLPECSHPLVFPYLS